MTRPKSPSGRPILHRQRGAQLGISGAALLELMKEVLAKGAVFRFQAQGKSMSPFIKNGDVITIAPFAIEKLSVGKVVAFIQSATGQLVVHRVIGRRGAAFLIQGDNAAGQTDDLVQPAEILGCVTRVERNGRRVYLGLGPERYLVAILSRSGWLAAVLRRLWSLKSKFQSHQKNAP